MKTIEPQTDLEFLEISTKEIARIIRSAIEERGECLLGLSGGSTPRPIYEKLGKDSIDWSKVKIFLVDERHVAAEDRESNQRLVRETLLKYAKIPANQCVFPNCSLPIDACIADFVKRVKELWGDYLPDLVILGMGDDGHIASLFPPLSDLELSEQRFALHTTTDRFAVPNRISLALNPIAAAQAHVFLLKGAAKRHVWEEMIKSEDDERRWPAKRVMEQSAECVVIIGSP